MNLEDTEGEEKEHLERVHASDNTHIHFIIKAFCPNAMFGCHPSLPVGLIFGQLTRDQTDTPQGMLKLRLCILKRLTTLEVSSKQSALQHKS